MNPYFIPCPDYNEENLESALKELLAPLGGMRAFVKPGQSVLLKPNLLAADAPEKRVTTDPALVKAVARLALACGGQVSIGDSPALDSFSKVGQRSGMREVAGELGVPLIELSQPVRVNVPPGGKYKSLELARQALNADVVINLPKLKTHSQMILTMAVKNMFGTVVAQRKARWHHMAGNDVITFASMLLDVCRTINPALTIMDGIWGMEGQGPSNGTPRHFGFLAAAADPLTLDLNLAAMLGLSWEQFPLAQAAHTLSLIPSPLPAPQWLNQRPHAAMFANMNLPRQRSLRFLPGFLEGITRRYLVSKPEQNTSNCILCLKCAQICPEKCISQQGKLLKFNYRQCIRCYCCQEVCPVNAINLKPGFLEKTLQALGK